MSSSAGITDEEPEDDAEVGLQVTKETVVRGVRIKGVVIKKSPAPQPPPSSRRSVSFAGMAEPKTKRQAPRPDARQLRRSKSMEDSK